MRLIVLLATAWGSRHGGVNAFNADLAIALGALLAAERPEIQVACVVPQTDDAETAAARETNVCLLGLGRPVTESSISTDLADEVVRVLREKWSDAEIIAFVGHDLVSGELAIAVAEISRQGRSVVIHHTSYVDYQSYKHDEGQKAEAKFQRQRHMFEQASSRVAIGPLLRDRLADMLGIEPRNVTMLVPGLAEIEPIPRSPTQLIGITFGRLDPENDRIKQGRLAVAGFAKAIDDARKLPVPPSNFAFPPLYIVGINEVGGEEEASLHKLNCAFRPK